MAVKINTISSHNSSTTVLYSSPSFDEVFDDVDINIAEDSIKVGMIEDIYSNKSAKVSLKNKSRKFLEVSDYEWFPNFGALKANISPPLPSLESGQIENTDLDALRLSLDEISYSLNGLVIAKGKSGTATRGDSITLGGEIKIKKPFISAALRYKGASQASNLKMLSLLKYDLEKNITIESKANIKGDIAGVINKFDKGWKCGSVIKTVSDHISVDISGAKWESEVCLGGFRVGLGYVGVIVGNGNKSIPVPLAMDVFITTNAKFEIGISSKLTLSKKSHRDMGFWIEPAIDVYETFSDEYDTTEYLRTGKKVAPVWKKTIEGKAFGSMSMSVGTAQALKVLGIYPVVSRAYGGPELKAIVKGSIEEDGLNGCYEMSLSPLYGFAFGFGLSAKVKLANLPEFWDKKTIGGSISYTYKKDNSKDDNKSGVQYNNCLPEGYTGSFDVVVNSDGTTFNNVNVIHSEVTGNTNIDPTSILWNVYSDGQLVTTHSGESLNYELPSGNYSVSMVATLPDGNILTDIRNITVYSAPTNISLLKNELDATLSWDAIQGVQEYSLCLSEQPIINEICPSEDDLSTSSTNSTTFHSLKPNQQYYVGVFYEIDGQTSPISNIVNFTLEETTPPVDNNKIAMLLGVSNYAEGDAITSDSDGNIYAIGGIYDTSFDGQNGLGGRDIILVKYDINGEKLWSKRLGTNEQDMGLSVHVSNNNQIIIGGYTSNYLSNKSGTDAYIIVLDENGNNQWSYVLGGDGGDRAYSVTSDKNGNVYLVGTSSDYEGIPSKGNGDIFVTKFSENGTNLWNKLLGGISFEIIKDIKIDKDNNVYLAGLTHSSNFNSQVVNDSYDAFILKLNSDGSQQWHKVLGGESTDGITSIKIMENGNILAFGYTYSTTFNGENRSVYSNEHFLLKYDSSGNNISSKLLGFDTEQAEKTVLVSDSNIYILYESAVTHHDGHQNLGLTDVYVSKFDLEGNKLWTEQFGGSGNEYLNNENTQGIYIDTKGNIYITGRTQNLYGNSRFEGIENNAESGYEMFTVRFSDPDITGSISENLTDSDFNRQSYIDIDEGMVLSFKDDGTGFEFNDGDGSNGSPYKSPFTWSVTNNKLDVNYTNGEAINVGLLSVDGNKYVIAGTTQEGSFTTTLNKAKSLSVSALDGKILAFDASSDPDCTARTIKITGTTGLVKEQCTGGYFEETVTLSDASSLDNAIYVRGSNPTDGNFSTKLHLVEGSIADGKYVFLDEPQKSAPDDVFFYRMYETDTEVAQ